MTGEIEAAGEIVTGALIGRAVEPRAGEGGGVGERCLNCGTALVGPHCHRCGQSAHVHRSLGAIGHEILHGVVHFEGKLWRTLPLLAWRPGELTRRYIEGERARFVSPTAIFLFSVFAMFAAFSWAGVTPDTQLPIASTRSLDAIKAEQASATKARAKALSELKDPDSDAADRAEAQADLAEAETQLRALRTAADALDGKTKSLEGKVDTGWHALDHGIEKWQKNPALMIYKLQAASYKFSWLLIPLSLPFVWLLFAWKRQYKLYDHAVFITYSIAFMSMLFIVTTIASAAGVPNDWVALVAMVVPPIHIARQLKQAYALRWTSAILRTIVLMFLIGIILVLFLIVLLALGMFA